MPDDIANHTLAFLRRLDGRLDRLADDMQDVKARLGSLEQKMAIVVTDLATLSVRMDRMDARLERIEKRLDLVEA